MKNFGKSLIIQPSPGIGDMIWHLPYFRALTKFIPDHKFTLLTKERGCTKEWLACDPMIEDIFYFERRGLLASIPLLREQNFDTVWILHRSFSYALMAWLAGIKNVYGFGFGAQRIFLTTPIFLPENMKSSHTIENLKKILKLHEIDYEDQAYKITLSNIDQTLLAEKYKSLSKPWIVFGIGGSGQEKHWPIKHFAELAKNLKEKYGGTIFLCGGPNDQADADIIIKICKTRDGLQKVCNFPLNQSLALVSLCNLYIGNDTGLMNAAACLQRPALGLYASTPILDYVPTLYGIKASRMEQILPQQVVTFIQHNNLL